MSRTSFTQLSRRDWLRLSALGALGAPASCWLETLAARAADDVAGGRPKHQSCILLFMTGGPSHIDTFDPKPENDTSGFSKPIDTSVPGIQVCEHLPQVAQIMQDCTRCCEGCRRIEGSHGRAPLLHAYWLSAGGWRSDSRRVSERLPRPALGMQRTRCRTS